MHWMVESMMSGSKGRQGTALAGKGRCDHRSQLRVAEFRPCRSSLHVFISHVRFHTHPSSQYVLLGNKYLCFFVFVVDSVIEKNRDGVSDCEILLPEATTSEPSKP